jgi:ribosomal protein S27AE
LLATGGEATREFEDLHHAMQQPVKLANRLCPSCKGPLDAYQYQYSSPVTIEGCPDCGGVFLEDGELASIQD